MPEYKPSGYQNVVPYLVVDGAERLIAFNVRGHQSPGNMQLRRRLEETS